MVVRRAVLACRPLATPGAAGLVALCALLVPAGPGARAATLVSNVNQTSDKPAGAPVYDTRPTAEYFRTGSTPAGYTLQGVDLKLDHGPSENGTFTLSVRQNDPTVNPSVGAPGAVLYTLIGPPSVRKGLNVFAAPAGARLDPDSTYWIVATWSKPWATGVPYWAATRSNPNTGSKLDPGGAPGFGIANGPVAGIQQGFYLNGVWRWGWVSSHSAVQMAIRGSALNSPASCATPALGIARVGETLTAPTRSISDPDGRVAPVWEFKWFRVDADGMSGAVEIKGATGRRYVPVEDDIGKRLRVAVDFLDDAGNRESVTCEATDPVGAASDPPDPEPEPEERGPANDPPVFTDLMATRSVQENSPADVAVGDPVTATDPDMDPLAYRLEGTDAPSFAIVPDSGQILTVTGVLYDYETKNTYALTVVAEDGRGGMARIDVTVLLTDEAEMRPDGRVPRAWLARFGRTVAGQVVQAVDECAHVAPPRPGLAMRLAGVALPKWPDPAGPGRGEPGRQSPGERESERTGSGGTDSGRFGSDGTGLDGIGSIRSGQTPNPVTARTLLAGTALALTAQAPGDADGTVSLCARGALSSFEGRVPGAGRAPGSSGDGARALDGEVGTVTVAAEWTPGGRIEAGNGSTSTHGSMSAAGSWSAGLLLSHSRGEGGWRGAPGSTPEAGGTISSSLTGLFPYGRYRPSPRLVLWGVAGYGSGALTLEPGVGPAVRAGTTLVMAAAGLRGTVLETQAGSGPEISLTADGLAVHTASARMREFESADDSVTRLRLGLAGVWRGLKAGGGTLAPRFEIGLRLDGGDAESGFGLEIATGLAWSQAASGVSAEFAGRGLLTHEARGFRDTGFAVSLAWHPDPDAGRGPRLRLTSVLGGPAAGGMAALFGHANPVGRAAAGAGGGTPSLELRAGYGVAAFGDRFTAIPGIGLALSNGHREYSLNWRFEPVRGSPGALSLELHASRRESADSSAETEHVFGFRLAGRF